MIVNVVVAIPFSLSPLINFFAHGGDFGWRWIGGYALALNLALAKLTAQRQLASCTFLTSDSVKMETSSQNFEKYKRRYLLS